MATLVLSTVGQALGGPVGGAIGALIGQSLDQQLLASPRRGPRLGDLSVQTSTYGTQIPRLYGSMRVAGSVIWSTDLIESEETSGAKGQPDVSYNYSISLAVALSSRVAGSVGRIWADGQLIRGAAGDLKVPVTFRFYDGSEDQAIDPLIGSIEGINSTPAYRGLAVAVFERLQLATFGNRVPFMTFEVIADSEPPSLGAILSDASKDRIIAAEEVAVVGYAAYGGSIARSVEPIISAFGISLFDDGANVTTVSEVLVVDGDDFGCSPDGTAAPSIERERSAVLEAPQTLRLSYYDQSRDYQAGEARAIAGSTDGAEAQHELPAVIHPDQAKAIAQKLVGREWSGLDRLKLRLPPRFIGMKPGTTVTSSAIPGSWTVEKATVDGFAIIAELRKEAPPSVALAADGGRAVMATDVVETEATLAMLDLPDITGSGTRSPMIAIAMSCASSGWRKRTVEVAGPGFSTLCQSATRKSLLGSAIGVLGGGSATLVDLVNVVDVQLIEREQWLTSCTDEALAADANQAVLGEEIFQFGQVTPLGDGRFRLSRLLRGRAGTDWAIGQHHENERFCLIDRDRLVLVEVPLEARGTILTVSDDRGGVGQGPFCARSVQPFSPAFLKATINVAGGLEIGWTRRSRAGLAWIDDVDAPLGESTEQYRVRIEGTAKSVESATAVASFFVSADDVRDLGAGPASIQVSQIGDFAASEPTAVSIVFP